MMGAVSQKGTDSRYFNYLEFLCRDQEMILANAMVGGRST
jgi:hypothetical protein